MLLFCLSISLSIHSAQAGENTEGGSLHGGGGGQITNDGKLSLPQFESLVNQVKAVLPLIFNGLSLGNRDQDFDGAVNGKAMAVDLKANVPKLYEKLFPSTGPTIFEILPKAQYSIHKDSACHHPNRPGNLSGSAYLSGFLVCLSYPEAKSILNTANAEKKLLGLMAHEVSHLLGATEKEADALQVIVESKLSGKPLSDLQSALDQMKMDLKIAHETFLGLNKSITSQSRAKILLKMNAANNLFEFLHNRQDYAAGFSFFTRTEEARARSLIMQSIASNIYILKDAQSEEIDEARNLLNDWLKGGYSAETSKIYMETAKVEGHPFYSSDFNPQDQIFNLDDKEHDGIQMQLDSMIRIIEMLQEKIDSIKLQ